MFNFRSLIKQFGKIKPFKIVKEEGSYDYNNSGIWVDGAATEVEFEGAVAPMPEKVLKDDLTYTTEDKKLYCYDELETNSTVKHKDIEYTVMEKAVYEDFDADLKIYMLKRGGLHGI